jgi:hypothetical protein
MDIRQLHVDICNGGWCLRWPDGDRFDNTKYKRAQDAKRALTMMLRDYNVY